MGTVEKLALEVRRGLEEALPGLRKTILKKLPLAVAALLESRSPNTMEISGILPLDSENVDTREQWLRRLLKNRLLISSDILSPFGRRVLSEVSAEGQTILLSMDQTEIEDRFAILMISVRVGDRSLPLVWHVEAGAANIGFEGQRALLEKVKSWLPTGASAMLLADRFYPSAALFEWLKAAGWQYRLRLKGNLAVDIGCAGITTTGELAAGMPARYEPAARLFGAGIATAIGVLHEAGHKEPWIIAMDCMPTRATVLDYGARWSIEPTFSDFKTRGFRLEDTQLEYPDRLDRLLLIMTLAMYWCVVAGREAAIHHPTPTEKKPGNRKTRTIPSSKNSIAAHSRGSSVDCGCY
jgi:hypothetical protein